MTRLTATQRRYARSPRRSAAPRGLASTRPCKPRVSRPTFRKSRRLSVCLLIRRHRSAGCQPKQPAPRSGVALGAGFGAFHGLSTRIVSGDENLAMKDVRRTALASHGRDSNLNLGKLALKHGRRHTIAVAVSSGQQPGAISSGRVGASAAAASKRMRRARGRAATPGTRGWSTTKTSAVRGQLRRVGSDVGAGPPCLCR